MFQREIMHILNYAFLISSIVMYFSCVRAANVTCTAPLVGEEISNLSTLQLITKLTDPCRYDRWQRPGHKDGDPVHVYARIHIYFLGSIEAQNLVFTAHILIMFRWHDPRLALPEGAKLDSVNLGTNGNQGLLLNDKIWIPHLYLSNERESVVLGAGKKDIRLKLHPDGMVQQSVRMKVTLYCLMNLQKFPFDQQNCPLIVESWAHNTSDLILTWEDYRPVSVNSELLLTEYRLLETRTFSSEQPDRPARGRAVPVDHRHNNVVYETLATAESNIADSNDTADEGSIIVEVNFDADNSDFFRETGNFSSLEIKFHLAREVGHYIMDYYIPSILLVFLSWVSFWLDPNAIPGRTTLGTSAMLMFITLTSNTNNSLPKVAYIKATEVWFMVCTAYIFGSLLEFAFVNTIWRRRKQVPLKKVSSKYILKHTMDPRMARRALSSSVGSNLDDAQSPKQKERKAKAERKNDSTRMSPLFFKKQNKLNVGPDGAIYMKGPPTKSASVIDVFPELARSDEDISITIQEELKKKKAAKTFTTMTPQQIAKWIDVRSRLWFPLTYVVFLFLYFGFVWL